MILISYNLIYLWSAIFVKCGFFSTATYLISKNCLILVLLSSIKKLQRICVTILETNANICIKTSKQLIYTVLFRDVSFLFNVFFLSFIDQLQE